MLVIIISLIFYNIYCQDLDSLNISTKYDYIIIIDFMLIMIISTRSKISYRQYTVIYVYSFAIRQSHLAIH